MRDWILVGVMVAAALAPLARAQQADLPDAGTQRVMVEPVKPVEPVEPAGEPRGAGPGPAGTADGGSDAPLAGSPETTPEEQIILLVPPKPPPPPEPPRQIRVTVMHHPRPRVEWGQAALELGVSSGVFLVGSATLLAVELVPIVISELLGARDVSNTMQKAFSVGNAFILPIATTIAIEKTKAYSRHYELEGLGWWATYGTGLAVQLISSAITVASERVDIFAPHLLVFGALTPVSQTVVANVLATPRDPLSPLETSSRAPILLDGNGRPIRVVNVLTVTF